MRKPTSADQMYAWHTAAVAGDRPATHEDEPECGWFRTRMIRGGPYVPVRIWLVSKVDPVTGELLSDEYYQATINGERRPAVWAWNTANARPISEDAFNALCDLQASEPEMKATKKPIDLSARKAIRP